MTKNPNEDPRDSDSVKSPDEDAALQDLDTTVITNPLRQHMKRDRKGSSVHSVVVEVNLRHSDGPRATKQHVMDHLKSILGLNAGGAADYQAGKPYLFQRKSELGGHYVFADLTTAQIRELARWNREPGKPLRGGAGSRGAGQPQQPIYKIWEDFKLELYLDRSVSTVKADAARVAFGATGEGIVWAVLDSGVQQHRHFEKYQNLDLDRLGLQHMDFSLPEPKPLNPEELRDEIGHGTHVAGIIAGETSPRSDEEVVRGVAYVADELGNRSVQERTARELRGVAPQCKIVSLKVDRTTRSDCGARIRAGRQR